LGGIPPPPLAQTGCKSGMEGGGGILHSRYGVGSRWCCEYHPVLGIFGERYSSRGVQKKKKKGGYGDPRAVIATSAGALPRGSDRVAR